jgi:hypothetical protein
MQPDIFKAFKSFKKLEIKSPKLRKWQLLTKQVALNLSNLLFKI